MCLSILALDDCTEPREWAEIIIINAVNQMDQSCTWQYNCYVMSNYSKTNNTMACTSLVNNLNKLHVTTISRLNIEEMMFQVSRTRLIANDKQLAGILNVERNICRECIWPA